MMIHVKRRGHLCTSPSGGASYRPVFDSPFAVELAETSLRFDNRKSRQSLIERFSL